MRRTFGIATITSAVLLTVAACTTTPTPKGTEGTNAKPNKVGAQIKVSKDSKIAAMVPGSMRGRGSFTASINPDVAPVKFVDDKGHIAGLVPDLLQDAATTMGLKLDLQQGNFDAMVPGLEAERFDVIASIGDYKERRGKIDFIDYLQSGTAILTSASFSKSEITPDKDLCGLSIGYVRGTSQQGLIDQVSKACTAAGRKAVKSAGYGDSGAALLSVKSGQADAFWGDSPAMLFNAKTSPKLYKVVFTESSGKYGIAINKDNSQFRDALRAALLKLVSTGVYDQLLHKWGQEEFGIPNMPLNAGPSLKK